MTLLASKLFKNNGFDISVKLEGSDFLSSFNTTWQRDVNGLIVGSEGDKWTTNDYSIGQLKKGFDVTVNSAQKRFNRDCLAFDVSLVVTVHKKDVELLESYVINSDYNYDDKETPEEIMENLSTDYLELDNIILEAKQVLKSLLTD